MLSVLDVRTPGLPLRPPAMYLRSDMMEVNGVDPPASLMSWSPGSTELHAITSDLYEQKMKDASLL